MYANLLLPCPTSLRSLLPFTAPFLCTIWNTTYFSSVVQLNVTICICIHKQVFFVFLFTHFNATWPSCLTICHGPLYKSIVTDIFFFLIYLCK